MGQKVNSNMMRIGIIKDWNNNWYEDKLSFSYNLYLDHFIRDLIKKKIDNSVISKIEIERSMSITRVIIFSIKPSLILGKYNKEIDNIKKSIFKLTKENINILIQETVNLNSNAIIISKFIATQLEKRVLFKRVIKKLLFSLEKYKLKGIKIRLKGRINGIEIARTENFKVGSIPLQTFCADIDYGFSEAFTKYGIIGVKVWIFNNN